MNERGRLLYEGISGIMARIQQMESHTAELIAAGEVVERPASVVKELTENAIDAGANVITVRIRRGGMGLIQISDDGCGIAPEELPAAFLRHATSKLRSIDDLAQIRTLGFRGEALAAIAAVSRIAIKTRERGADTGAELCLEGGVPGEVEETGAPEGTTITVRDLFYNTPARLKFMRTDSAETAAIAGLLRHLSLSHPEISFCFYKDGAEDLRTPGDGKLDSAVYAALGRDFARTLIPVEGRGGETLVSGYVTAPVHGRGSRSMQIFFVNGRFIKSQLLTAALEEAYRSQLLKGKFPGCVLSVTLPAAQVDVNVHPAKTEIKFARESEVFNAVYHTVLDCLNERGGPIERESAEAEKRQTDREKPDAERPEKSGGFFRHMDAKTYREQVSGEQAGKAQSDPPVKDADPFRPAWDNDPAEASKSEPPAVSQGAAQGVSQGKKENSAESDGKKFAETGNPPENVVFFCGGKDTETGDTPDRQRGGGALNGQTVFIDNATVLPWRIVGEVTQTYVICETAEGDVYFIDKHAAHERVNFDRLQAMDAPPMRQALLRPVAAELSAEDAAILLDHLPLLEELGFGCEDFGDGTVLVREIPADLDGGGVTATLEELAEDLRTGRGAGERREKLLATIACKASIKGGWENDERELRVLVDKVQSGEVRYCPHGRPVAVKLAKSALEKMFKRA